MRMLYQREARGVAFMFGAILLFSMVGVIAKHLSTRYPANEITFFRMLFGLIPAVFALWPYGQLCVKLKPYRLWSHFLRATMALSSMGLFFSSLPYLPLSTAVTLQYTEAIFIATFAAACLGERVRAATVLALIAGLVGVMLISPLAGKHASLLGTSLALLSAAFGAGSVIQIKRLSRTEGPVAIVLYFTLIATVLSGLSLFISWTVPTIKDLGYMALLGLAAGLGQLMLTIAFRNAPASRLAPISYFGVIWAMLFEYLFWGTVMSTLAVVGAVMIIGSALCITMYGKNVGASDTSSGSSQSNKGY
ncbi:DMT family transporter [Mycetohabitans endofungorum]|nr:DMT family transporter [Mycetohabitans sp. B3]